MDAEDDIVALEPLECGLKPTAEVEPGGGGVLLDRCRVRRVHLPEGLVELLCSLHRVQLANGVGRCPARTAEALEQPSDRLDHRAQRQQRGEASQPRRVQSPHRRPAPRAVAQVGSDVEQLVSARLARGQRGQDRSQPLALVARLEFIVQP